MATWNIGAVQSGGATDIGAVQSAVAVGGTILPQITSAYMNLFIKIFIMLLI